MVRKFAFALGLAALAVGTGISIAQNPPAGQTTPPATQTPAPSTQTPPPAATEPAPPATQAPSKFPEGPPAELKKLSFLEGNWQEKTHVYAGMLGPETDYTGKSQLKWEFNGMHLVGTHNYQLRGKPMVGHSVWGWDYEQKKYQLIWVNATTPTTSVYYGAFNGDSTLVLYSTFMAGGKAVTERVTYVFSGRTYTFTMESDLSGTMSKVMEMVGTKSAAASSASKKPGATKKAGTKSGAATKKPG